ncbi:MAG: hypothetical protein H0X66_05550 [Verrucomicrobia bacterium]|nr:hypothetical protein [Verrucomicrobiota bacterium]
MIRDSFIKTFLSLCLLNLFLFLQFLVASEQLTKSFQANGEPELRCAVTHWSLNAHAEIVSTDVFIPEPRYIWVGENNSTFHFVVCDYFIIPGRGPPTLHT